MKESAVQQELFEGLEAPKRKRKLPYSILPKNYIPFNISYEQVVFITIGVIMLMVLLFSIGVEKGKRLSRPAQRGQAAQETADIEPIALESTLAPEPVAVEQVVVVQPPAPQAVEAAQEAPKRSKIVKQPTHFTIQLIAYRSKKSAQQELERLGKKGYSPFIIVGGEYYQICVGKYRARSKAKEELLELKKAYRDSFIRKR